MNSPTPDNRDTQGTGYFLGTEVENSPYKGLPTLFVVGDSYSATALLQVGVNHSVQHVYLAANQSFGSRTTHEWVNLAKRLCADFFVTLDVPLEALPDLVTYSNILHDNPSIHIMLSVKARNIDSLPRVTVKLDDVIPNVVNPGVWCITNPLSQANFTPWSAYAADSSLTN